MGSASASLEIHLLGAPQLLLNGQALDRLSRKNCALLYYLAVQDQPLAREQGSQLVTNGYRQINGD